MAEKRSRSVGDVLSDTQTRVTNDVNKTKHVDWQVYSFDMKSFVLSVNQT